MAKTTKAERDQTERRAKVRKLMITLFELSGKMTQTIRHAEEVGFTPVSQQVMWMQRKIDRLREQIRAKSVTWD